MMPTSEAQLQASAAQAQAVADHFANANKRHHVEENRARLDATIAPASTRTGPVPHPGTNFAQDMFVRSLLLR